MCMKMHYKGSTDVKCLTKDDCDNDKKLEVGMGIEQGSMDPIPYRGGGGYCTGN